MATATEVRAITSQYRRAQVRQAATIAALVALEWRRMDAEDGAQLSTWLELMIPKILDNSDSIGQRAARYASDLRRLEIGGSPTVFEVKPGSSAGQVRTSLSVVGPTDYFSKINEIRALDVKPAQVRMLEREAKQVVEKKIAASVLRHAQSSGRATLINAAHTDPAAQGYVRVTSTKPCFFCAMLASRGQVFAEDSFDYSDTRFVGDGTVKVHDKCQCSMKAVYNPESDPIMADVAKFEDMWSRWGAGGGDSLLRFRRGYEHWAATGVFLDFDVVNDLERFKARNKAA